MITLWIPTRMPGLNELFEARMVRSRNAGSPKQWNRYSDMKRQWGSNIKLLCFKRRFEFIERSCFTYLFVEPNRGRDKSNVIGGGVKLIEDGLIEAGIIKGDGWAVVNDIRPYVIEREFAGVLMVAHETRVLERDEMIELMEKEYERGREEGKGASGSTGARGVRAGNPGDEPVRSSNRKPARGRARAGGELPVEPKVGSGQ